MLNPYVSDNYRTCFYVFLSFFLHGPIAIGHIEEFTTLVYKKTVLIAQHVIHRISSVQVVQ